MLFLIFQIVACESRPRSQTRPLEEKQEVEPVRFRHISSINVSVKNSHLTSLLSQIQLEQPAGMWTAELQVQVREFHLLSVMTSWMCVIGSDL